MVFGCSRHVVSCEGRNFNQWSEVRGGATTESFTALDGARLQIEQLDLAMASAHETGIDEDLLAHVIEVSDTACFSVSSAEAQYFSALQEYEASFHPLRRRMKKFGTRTKAYHALNVEPREARLMQARMVFEKAAELKRKMEKSLELAEQASAPLEINFRSTTTLNTELLGALSGTNVFGSQFSEPLSASSRSPIARLS